MIKLHEVILQREGELRKVVDVELGNIREKGRDFAAFELNPGAELILVHRGKMIGMGDELLPLAFLRKGNPVNFVAFPLQHLGVKFRNDSAIPDNCDPVAGSVYLMENQRR